MSIRLQTCNADAVCDPATDMCEPVPEAGESCVTKCAEGSLCEDGVCTVSDPIACLYDDGDGD